MEIQEAAADLYKHIHLLLEAQRLPKGAAKALACKYAVFKCDLVTMDKQRLGLPISYKGRCVSLDDLRKQYGEIQSLINEVSKKGVSHGTDKRGSDKNDQRLARTSEGA